MTKSRLLLSLIALSGLTLAACAAPADEVADEATGSSEAAATPEDATYYAVSRVDMRRCASPYCGGVYVKAVNSDLLTGEHKGKTRCADRTWQTECYVGKIDYRSFRTDDTRIAFDSAFKDQFGIVRGNLVQVSPGRGAARYGKLVATEAWRGRKDRVAQGTFASLTLPDVVCLSLSCARGYLDISNNASGPTGVQSVQYANYIGDADREAASAAGHKAGLGLITQGKVTTRGALRTLTISQFYTSAEVVFGGEGVACGADAFQQCASDHFCKLPQEAECGAVSHEGTCTARPMICTKEYRPVCGCDGQTYGNACMARSAGASVASFGECAPPPAQEGESCGGDTFSGAPACADGLFCNYTLEAPCGAAGVGGTCARIPQICTREYAPVCGCDGKTYPTKCVANSAGVAVQAQGECAPPPPAQEGESCGGDMIGGSPGCGEGLFCNYTLEAICGAADASGTCTRIPEICTFEYNPVCGCDEKTYSNTCGAHAAGVAVAKPGPCGVPAL